MAMAVANRYARALADVLGPGGDYRRVLQELEHFRAVYVESVELREVLETPAVALQDKLKILGAILKRLGTSTMTSNFLRVLVTNYRIALLDDVLQAFQKVAYDRLGIARVKVFSAHDLSKAEREALRARFAEVTKKQVEIEFLREANLLGGVMAQIESTVYDGSVRGHLDRMREQLLAR